MSVQYETVTFVKNDIIIAYPYTGLSNCVYTRWCIFYLMCYSFTGACQYKQLTNNSLIVLYLHIYISVSYRGDLIPIASKVFRFT